jgi:cation transport ATPase
MCKKTIEKAALSVRGVKMAIWDIPSNKLSLLYNHRKVEVKNIHNAIAKSGYSTFEVKSKEEDYNKLPMCCQY